MKRVKIKQVDAFTKIPFCGNPAGVVTVASGLTEEQMLSIAREMSVSETVFFFPPTSPKADLSIRWFTPKTEVELCGHATIAGFYTLAEEKKYGMEKIGTYKFKVQTKKGILDVIVKVMEKDQIKVSFFIPIPEFSKSNIDMAILKNIFKSDIFDNSLPIMSSGWNIVIPVRGLDCLFNVNPDYSGMIKLGEKSNIEMFTLLSLETIDTNSKLHLRCFAPYVGVNEDPVTGSSQGEVGVYMVKNKLIEGRDGKYSYIGEQGDCLKRPGRVEVFVLEKDNKIDSLSITGTAVTVISGSMYI
jgi:PhzF family phenazine biosynthesis protein